MFNNSKKAVVTYDSEAEKVVTLIGTGAVCDGPFSAKDSTRIDGTINGAVRIDGSLIVGHRLDVLDDEALILMRGQLPNAEVGFPILTGPVQKGGFPSPGNSPDETEAA